MHTAVCMVSSYNGNARGVTSLGRICYIMKREMVVGSIMFILGIATGILLLLLNAIPKAIEAILNAIIGG